MSKSVRQIREAGYQSDNPHVKGGDRQYARFLDARELHDQGHPSGKGKKGCGDCAEAKRRGLNPAKYRFNDSSTHVKEDLLNVPHDNKAASGPDLIKRTQNIARNAQKPSVKNKITAIAGKQYEPNRTKPRHPSTPHQHITGPNELGGMSEATSQEGEFDAKESNKEFAEKLKQMAYKNAKTVKEIREGKEDKKAFMTKLHKDQFHYNHQMWQKAEEAGDRDASQHYADMAHHHAHWHKKISGQDVIPHFKSKGPMHEGRNNEYDANRHMTSTSNKSRKPGHYLMRHGVPIHNEPHASSQAALSAYHNLSDKSNVKIQHVREMTEQFLLGDKVCVDCAEHPQHGQHGTLQGVDHMGGHHVSFKDGQHSKFDPDQLKKVQPRQGSAIGSISSSGVSESVAMAAGAAGDPGAVQDPTSNYAAQLDQRRVKKPIKLFKRPRPGSTMSGNKP